MATVVASPQSVQWHETTQLILVVVFVQHKTNWDGEHAQESKHIEGVVPEPVGSGTTALIIVSISITSPPGRGDFAIMLDLASTFSESKGHNFPSYDESCRSNGCCFRSHHIIVMDFSPPQGAQWQLVANVGCGAEFHNSMRLGPLENQYNSCTRPSDRL